MSLKSQSQYILIAAAIVAIGLAVLLVPDREMPSTHSGYKDSTSPASESAVQVQEHSEQIAETAGTETAGIVEKARQNSLTKANVDEANAGEPTKPPIQLYGEYILAANSGDAIAIAVVLDVLHKCDGMKGDNFVEKIQTSDLPQDLVESEIRRFRLCTPLLEEIDNFDADLNRLAEEFASSQHPLFLVRHRDVSADVKRDRLISVVLSDLPEIFLYERAFMEAAVYHRQYADRKNKYREEAWTLLYCELNSECDAQLYRDELRFKTYRQHEYSEISEIESSIKNAIAEGDAGGLGF